MTTDPHARIARAHLRHRALPTPDTPTPALGRITLHPHQHAAIAPLLHRLRRFHGALLADAPGLGKTYVALAVADALHVARPLVIAPAILRTRWLEAARETGTRLRFRSVESLSHDGAHATRTARPIAARHPSDTPTASADADPYAPPPSDDAPGFVIIDEAHHLRTTTTRRWHAAATLVAHARVLLLSATPIHNRTDDLAAIAALFHVAPGSRDLDRLLRRITVRRPLPELLAAEPNAARALHLPRIGSERAIALPPRDGATLDAIHRLPPLPTAHDLSRAATSADDARSRLALVHAWASSTAALAAMLRRRIARCIAIEAACDEGLAPSPALTRAWQVDTDGTTVQLALAALLAPPSDIAPTTLDRRRRATARHRHALERLLATLGPAEDDARARALARLARWGGAPVVAFTRSRTTARALWRRLRHLPGTALLTGDEAEIASGPVPRDALIAMLRDGAGHDTPATARSRAVRLLVATDVASEGISLAGTRTVVHLDRPWTPARLEQRVGRAARIGAPVHAIAVVALTPPATTADVARVERILATKAGLVARLDHTLRDARSTHDAITIAALAHRWLTVPVPHDHAAPIPPHHTPSPPAELGRPWLIAMRVAGHARVRVVDATGRLARPTLADWQAADTLRRQGDACTTTVPSHVRRAVARWWAARDDPLDRAAPDHTPVPHEGDAAEQRRRTGVRAEAPALAAVRRAVDHALVGASPLERNDCGRGAAWVRRRLAAGVGARVLDDWGFHAADPARCRAWLATLARARHAPDDRSDPRPAVGVGGRLPSYRAAPRGLTRRAQVVAAVPMAGPATPTSDLPPTGGASVRASFPLP